MNVVVIREMSAGNESVGEMWKETKVFDGTDTLEAVLQWAGVRKQITITVPDGEKVPPVLSEPLPF